MTTTELAKRYSLKVVSVSQSHDMIGFDRVTDAEDFRHQCIRSGASAPFIRYFEGQYVVLFEKGK